VATSPFGCGIAALEMRVRPDVAESRAVIGCLVPRGRQNQGSLVFRMTVW